MSESISLSQLKICLQGIVPSVICTHDQNLVPNVSYLSHVEYVDASHVALSNQFFSKTKQNVLANGKALIVVYHPASLQTYELHARFVKSEFDGDLFEKMNLRISILAGQDGMSQVYKLISADIYKIDKIEAKTQFVRHPAVLPRPEESEQGPYYQSVARGFLEVLNSKVFTEKEKVDLLYRTLQFGLGLSGPYLYLQTKNQSFQKISNVFSSVQIAKDVESDHTHVVHKAAHLGKMISLHGLSMQRRYYQVVHEASHGQQEDPGIARQLAIPLVRQGVTWAVLLVEDSKNENWDFSLIEALKIICAGCTMSFGELGNTVEKSEAPLPGFDFYWDAGREVLFLNQSPLLKSLPGQIFYYILQESKTKPKRIFSNQEVIAALKEFFPEEGKINFESRLALVRKRLVDRGLPFQVTAAHRGHFQLVIEEGFEYSLKSESK